MKHIFISYSHQDQEIADRLAADLRDAGLNATYDKWMLRVGDSILEKVASVVSEATFIIVLLSPSSVQSNWIKKELSLAMAGELAEGRVRVLPALIKECDIPPMLADKLYANFQVNYFDGLCSLLETLAPETYRGERFRHRASVEADYAELSSLLLESDAVSVKDWLAKHDYVVAAALPAYSVCDVGVVSRFLINDVAEVDFVAMQSATVPFLWLLQLGSTVLLGNTQDDAYRDVLRLKSLIQQWYVEHRRLQRLIALRIGRSPFVEYAEVDFRPRANGILFLGRRVEYQREWNLFRSRIYDRSNGIIEITSYDRVLDGLRRIFSFPDGWLAE